MAAERRAQMSGYGLAILSVVIATAARAALDGILGEGRVPFATYYVAVVATALLGALGPALLTTALSAVAGTFLFVAPAAAFAFDLSTFIAMAMFVVTGGIVTILAHRFQLARVRLVDAARTEAAQHAALGTERQRLYDIIGSIPGVVWEAWGEPDSSAQRIDFVSAYVETLLGYSPADWTSRPNFWLSIVHPDDRERAARVASDTYASGGSGENEFRWLTRDGRTVWVLARSSTILDETGAPIGMRGVTFDITDRKQVERRLELLAELSSTPLSSLSFEELAKAIARKSVDVLGDYSVLRMLRDGRLEAVAYAHVRPEAEPVIEAIAERDDFPALERLLAGVTADPHTIIDNDLSPELFANIERTGIEDLFEKYHGRHTVFTPLLNEGRVVGSLSFSRASGPPFSEADARLAEAIAARAAMTLENARLMDAAQREADDAQRARAAAEEAGRVKDEFLATLSHELRTPLNAIMGWTHMLGDPTLTPERHQTAIATILRNAQSQEQLIADLLDLQRIMTGKLRLHLRPLDISQVVRSAAETLQLSADDKDVRLQLLLDLDMPQIPGDPERLQQVVWNLLSNAIKFAPRGGGVQVRLHAGPEHCDLSVADDGPGIHPNFLPHVFERFRQADSSTTRTHKGLGLGLAIVRSLVEMHGGTITAGNRPAPDTGAIFTIRLPLVSAQAEPATVDIVSSEREPVWASAAQPLRDLRVLVVEDHDDGRELLVAVLHRSGAEVTAAASAAEGLRLYTEQHFDVIVSDIEMPGEDGYSLIRKVRALPANGRPDVPAAALTAYAGPADRMKALAAGFNIHVAKPVQPAELVVVVASLAGRSGERP